MPDELEADEEVEEPKLGVRWGLFYKMTLADMDEDFGVRRKKWEASNACEELKGMLRLNMNSEIAAKVTNVVALGIGSLHDVKHEGGRERTRMQLAAVMTIRDVLGGDTHVTCGRGK